MSITTDQPTAAAPTMADLIANSAHGMNPTRPNPTRAPRVWHAENQHGRWIATCQYGGFAGTHEDESTAEAVIDDYLAENPEDTRRPYGRWIIERSRDDRTRTAYATVEKMPNGAERRVKLSVSHWKDRKAFSVTLSRVTYHPPKDGSPFSSETLHPLADMKRVALDPIARFSAKALDAEWDAAVRRADLELAGDLSWLLDPQD